MDSALKELLLDAGKKKEQESDEVRTRHFISLKNGFLVFTTKLSVVSLKGYPSQLKVSIMTYLNCLDYPNGQMESRLC